jgi:hypothetical protein
MIRSQQNNMLSYIMSLQTNIFGVTTFTFHLKILFKKFSQQRAGYHIVKFYLCHQTHVYVVLSNISFLLVFDEW